MDEKFQDRIDDYLLNRMGDAEKAAFLQDVELDEEKKEQLEFTRIVRESICSREEKLRVLTQFKQQYKHQVSPLPVQLKKKTWLWISGIAAVLVVGYFAITPMFKYELAPSNRSMPTEHMRGGDDVFSTAPADSMDNDTVKFNIEKKIMPDE